MKQYQRQAVKLASEILSQPEFKTANYPGVDSYAPPRWCSLRAVNAECHLLRREQCQSCQWFKNKVKE